MSDIDVVEKVLADQPDLPVHVPYAGNTSPGIASFNTRDFIVEEDGAVQLSKDVQALTEEAVQAAANAKQSEQKAAESEANAKQSETNAKQSETNAKQSETNAASSETNAANSARSAQESASAAASSAEQAAESEETTNTLVERASTYAEQAEAQANAASESAASALRSKENAQQAATQATTEADRAESAADKAEQVVASIGTVYKPQGSLAFASLPVQPAEQYQGFVWNITDAFVTDNRFLEGAGEDVAAGANVACVYDNGQYKYDLLGSFIDVSKFSAVIDLGTFNKINDNTYTKALSTEIQNALKENNIAMMVSVIKESNTYKFTFCDYTRMVNEALLLEATILNVDDRGLFTQLQLSVAESAATFKISEVNLSNYYQKPSTGIPKTDLASAVQTSLGKADTALQSVPIATSSKVGGVKPAAKTSEMTQAVGVDSNGALWTAPASGVVDLGSLTEGANTISSELSQKVMDESCTIIKFELSNVVGQDIYCTRSIEVPTENGVAFSFTMGDGDDTIRTYGIMVQGTTAMLAIVDINAGGTTVDFATVDECAEAFNPTLMTF